MNRNSNVVNLGHQIVFPIVLFGFVFSSIYLRFADPEVEQIQILLHIGMAVIWFSMEVKECIRLL